MRESLVQNAAIEWLQALGYSHQPGNSLQRDLKKAELEDELRRFLVKTYPELPATALTEVITAFTQQEGMDLDHRNRDFHRKLTQGVSVSWKDAQDKEYARHVYPINYDAPEANSFICADEVTIIGKNIRRTDLIIYINGLPVVVFEFKNMFDAQVGIDNAHRQIGHYLQDIPQLFDYNALTVISDGMETLHGMYGAA
ncbi:MAG: type I restriction endonuclease, partial [Marinoscillum sp.]